jgi:hypothetical protein
MGVDGIYIYISLALREERATRRGVSGGGDGGHVRRLWPVPARQVLAKLFVVPC